MCSIPKSNTPIVIADDRRGRSGARGDVERDDKVRYHLHSGDNIVHHVYVKDITRAATRRRGGESWRSVQRGWPPDTNARSAARMDRRHARYGGRTRPRERPELGRYDLTSDDFPLVRGVPVIVHPTSSRPSAGSQRTYGVAIPKPETNTWRVSGPVVITDRTAT